MYDRLYSLFQVCFWLASFGGAMLKSARVVERMCAINPARATNSSEGTTRANPSDGVKGMCSQERKNSSNTKSSITSPVATKVIVDTNFTCNRFSVIC